MLEALVLAGGLVPLAAMILVLFAVSRVRAAAAASAAAVAERAPDPQRQ